MGAGAKNIILTTWKWIVFIYAQHLSRDTGHHESLNIRLYARVIAEILDWVYMSPAQPPTDRISQPRGPLFSSLLLPLLRFLHDFPHLIGYT